MTVPNTPSCYAPATALPWKTWLSLHDHSENVANATNDFVCEVGKICKGADVDAIKADARYIVHACNAYPQLIHALRELSPNHPLLDALRESAFNKEPEAVHA